MRHSVFELAGDEYEQALLVEALRRGDFPWQRIASGIIRQFGRNYVPVKLSDLSRYAASVRVYRDDDHGHDHHHEDYHVLEARHRVLGLYWLDGRIEVEQSLRDEPELLAEVLWSEGAHLIDYAFLTEEQRVQIGLILHGGVSDHHTWWERQDYSGEYRSLLGEAFMAVVCQAYTDIEPTIMLEHPASDEVGAQVRRLLTPDLAEPQFVGCRFSKVYHRAGAHRYSCSYAKWFTKQEAVAAGRRPCKRCLG